MKSYVEGLAALVLGFSWTSLCYAACPTDREQESMHCLHSNLSDPAHKRLVIANGRCSILSYNASQTAVSWKWTLELCPVVSCADCLLVQFTFKTKNNTITHVNSTKNAPNFRDLTISSSSPSGGRLNVWTGHFLKPVSTATNLPILTKSSELSIAMNDTGSNQQKVAICRFENYCPPAPENKTVTKAPRANDVNDNTGVSSFQIFLIASVIVLFALLVGSLAILILVVIKQHRQNDGHKPNEGTERSQTPRAEVVYDCDPFLSKREPVGVSALASTVETDVGRTGDKSPCSGGVEAARNDAGTASHTVI